jgi:hypothetical protein
VVHALIVLLKMRNALTLTLAIACLFSCERKTTKTTETISVTDRVEAEKSMIRYIHFNDTDGDIGVEINGDRAFLRQDSVGHKRTEIPYRDGLSLLEGFYAIPRIEEYRGKKSDDRQTSIQYLVVIYDEMPEHYSEEWVDYVIPNNSVELHPELNAWFESMRTTKEIADAEQAGTGQPATRPESNFQGGANPIPEAEGRSR